LHSPHISQSANLKFLMFYFLLSTNNPHLYSLSKTAGRYFSRKEYQTPAAS
jgi:hypothetical protein